MKRGSRKLRQRGARSRAPAILSAAFDRIGALLVESILGLWLGLALALLACWVASPHFQRALSGEILLGKPDHLCRPRIGGGPYLDSDRVTLADGAILVCDGLSGRWESPAARAERRSGWDGTQALNQ